MSQSISIYGVHVDRSGRILLVRDTSSMKWGFPGGGSERGEGHIDTLRREFFEETGLDITGPTIYITNQDDDIKQRFFYAISHISGTLHTEGNGSDIIEAAYFDRADLLRDNLASGVKDIIKAI